MKFQELKIPAAGTWARDCELIFLTHGKELKIGYYRDEDTTYWSLTCKGIMACKLVGEEISRFNYLSETPTDGAFYEILESPWIIELSVHRPEFFENCKHYVLQFYDETIEIIANEFIFEQLKERPSLKVEEKKIEVPFNKQQPRIKKRGCFSRYFDCFTKKESFVIQKTHQICTYLSEFLNNKKKNFVKFQELKPLGAKAWAKDCELIYLCDYKGLKVSYHRNEDLTYWSLHCGISAYKSVREEICLVGYLSDLPKDRAFYEIKDSPWIKELSTYRPDFFKNSKHYVLQFHDETIEVITSKLIFEQLKEPPSLKIEETKIY
jgi:hypothetical protein